MFKPVELLIRKNDDGTCVCVNAMTNSPFFSLRFAHENLLKMAVDEWNTSEGKSDPVRWSTLKIQSLPTPVYPDRCSWGDGRGTSCSDPATCTGHYAGGTRLFCERHRESARLLGAVIRPFVASHPDVVIVDVREQNELQTLRETLNRVTAERDQAWGRIAAANKACESLHTLIAVPDGADLISTAVPKLVEEIKKLRAEKADSHNRERLHSIIFDAFKVASEKDLEAYPFIDFLVSQIQDKYFAPAPPPICVGRPIIEILARDGQWMSETGAGLIAADGLFKKNPYEVLAFYAGEPSYVEEETCPACMRGHSAVRDDQGDTARNFLKETKSSLTA